MADSNLVLAVQRGDQEAKTLLISRFDDFLDQIAKTYSETGIKYDQLRELTFNSFLRTLETWSRDTEIEYAEFALDSICSRIETFISERADHLDIPHLNTDFHLRLVDIANQLNRGIQSEEQLPSLVSKLVNWMDFGINMTDRAWSEKVKSHGGVDVATVEKLLAAQAFACYLQPAGIAGPFDRIDPPEASGASHISSPELVVDSNFDLRAVLDEIDLDRF